MNIVQLKQLMNRLINIFKSIPRRLIGILIFRLLGGVAFARYKGVKVGEDCRIYIRQFGTEPFLINIGDRVTITSGVQIITHDGSTALVRNDVGRRYFHYAKVKIGNDVFIGVNSIILPGVTIGSNVVIGAGSIVTRNIPANSVAVGSPARVVGSFEEFHLYITKNYVNEAELDHISDYERRIYKAISLENGKA